MTAGPLSLVSFDALGTLVGLRDPVAGLRDALAARGVHVDGPEARAAMRAEIAYYRAHHDEAVDLDALLDLRRRCAAVVRDALAPTGLDDDAILAALLEAVRFDVLPGAVEALRTLRARGIASAVVSNWDVSLHAVLAQTGVAPLIDQVVTSAEAGVAKPDPAIFAPVLAGIDPAVAVHVGDSVEHDVHGALAAGMRAVLVAPGGAPRHLPPGVLVLPGLGGLMGPDGPLPYPDTDR